MACTDIILWNVNPGLPTIHCKMYNFNNLTLHTVKKTQACFGMRLKVKYMDINFTVAKLLWIYIPICLNHQGLILQH